MLKFFVTFVLFLIVLADDCEKAKYKECDQSIYNCCDAAFQKSVGITKDNLCSGTTVQDPTCVQTALDVAFYGSGRDGVFTVCDAYSAFRQCVDPAFESCTHQKWSLESGFDVQHSKSVEALYSSLGYACGAGMETFLRNEDCLVSNYDKNFIPLYQCSLTFNENIRKNDGKGCEYARRLAACYDLHFQDCGKEAAWWSCERVRTYATGMVGHGCAIDCSSGF